MDMKNDKKGLMASFVVGMEIAPEIVDAKTNAKNAEMVIQEWNLGPETPSEVPGENAEYWKGMADRWQIEEAEARRRMCANCEYFCNTPGMMMAMEDIPFNEMDEGAGGRGYCKKFSFICHNLRTCQAWDKGHDYYG